MTAYAEELAARLPRVAPDLSITTVVRSAALNLIEQTRGARALRATGARLVHHLQVYAPVFSPRPSVVTIHDLIHLHYPAQFKRAVPAYYATVVRAVCARAARVITDDPRTVGDLQRFLRVPPEKVVVIPLGVDDAFLVPLAATTPDRPYFLYVGNHRPHKDLATLYAAWAALPAECDVDLLLTGPDDMSAALRPRRERGVLRFLGDVPPAELPGLYAGATALVYPSLREGFGLPMLEAAAVGTPVIAATDAVPAVLRPHVAVFPSGDVRAAKALLDAALGERPSTEAARSVARTLTWDRCAERTAEVYRTVLAERRDR